MILLIAELFYCCNEHHLWTAVILVRTISVKLRVHCHNLVASSFLPNRAFEDGARSLGHVVGCCLLWLRPMFMPLRHVQYTSEKLSQSRRGSACCRTRAIRSLRLSCAACDCKASSTMARRSVRISSRTSSTPQVSPSSNDMVSHD